MPGGSLLEKEVMAVGTRGDHIERLVCRCMSWGLCGIKAPIEAGGCGQRGWRQLSIQQGGICRDCGETCGRGSILLEKAIGSAGSPYRSSCQQG